MALKNVFLAPLAKVKTEFWPSSMPAAHASCTVTRHDPHNIEVKTVSELGEGPSLVETDIFLFVPRNFELSANTKLDLVKDFRSRVRLALPVSGDLGATAFESALVGFRNSLERLEVAEKAGEDVSDFPHTVCEDALEATKDLCTVVEEILKHGALEHAREFFLSQTLMTPIEVSIQGLETLARQTQRMRELIHRVRSVAQADARVARSILLPFDEYISQLYVQYLAIIRQELGRLTAPQRNEESPTYAHLKQRLESLLDGFQQEEARHRARFGARAPELETEQDREHRLVRLSHLKKFFQSKTFVDITREQSAKKIGETTAIAGTALAGMIAAMIERYSHSRAGEVAFSSFFLVSLGVMVYVLRDRVKDWAITRFQESALRFLPDFQQHLVAKDRKIGRVQEWFRITTSKAVAPEILKFRHSVSATEMEKRLAEDVLHCRKVQEVGGATWLTPSHPMSRSLHENSRINVERYLKYMDDSFKDFLDLDIDGRILQSRSHRVYHFHICVRTISRPIEQGWKAKLKALRGHLPPGKEQILLYRIVMDRTGVLRLEKVA